MSQRNVETIQTMYEAAGRGDTQTMLDCLDPGVVVHEQESLPYKNTYTGHEGFQQLFRDLNSVWDEFRFMPQKFLDAGEVVIAYVQLQGKAKTTGKPLDMLMVELWQMKDGKGMDCRSMVWDTAAMLHLLQ